MTYTSPTIAWRGKVADAMNQGTPEAGLRRTLESVAEQVWAKVKEEPQWR